MSFILSSDIISVVVFVAEGQTYAKISLCIPASATDAATFLIKSNPVFSNGPRSLPINPPDYLILNNGVFDKLISVDYLLAKALRKFLTCLLVSNNL